MIVSLLNGGYGYSDYGMFNSIWICIGPTSRLDFTKYLDNSVLFTVCESLVELFVSIRAFMRMRAYAL